jgi:ankyrin repeat protein
MSFESLPIELFWLIANHLELPCLKEMANTCTFMFNLLDAYLYRKAFQSDEYKSRFLYAVVYGQTNAVSKFLQTGVLMSEFKDYTGYCSPYGRHRVPSVSVEKREALQKKLHPLLAAAFFGYVDVTKILLSEGKANIHFQDDFEKTALHWAVEADHPDVIQVLLERGAGIKYPRKNKITKSPFVYAAELGNKYAVELMVNELRNRGSQFDLRVLKDQSGKACYEACRIGYSDIVDFLLRQGVDVNLPIEQRRLLYWATIKGNLSTVKVLVKHGARMEHENDCGVVTALISSGSSRMGDVRMIVSAEKALHMLRSGCNVANGDILACALWCIAKCSGTTGHQWYATSDQREEMMRLMRKNGFDEKNCRHNCFKRRSDSLKDKLDQGELIRYVTNQGLRKWNCY